MSKRCLKRRLGCGHPFRHLFSPITFDWMTNSFNVSVVAGSVLTWSLKSALMLWLFKLYRKKIVVSGLIQWMERSPFIPLGLALHQPIPSTVSQTLFLKKIRWKRLSLLYEWKHTSLHHSFCFCIAWFDEWMYRV